MIKRNFVIVFSLLILVMLILSGCFVINWFKKDKTPVDEESLNVTTNQTNLSSIQTTDETQLNVDGIVTENEVVQDSDAQIQAAISADESKRLEECARCSNIILSVFNISAVQLTKYICFNGTEVERKEDCFEAVQRIKNCPTKEQMPDLVFMLEKNTLSQNRDVGNDFTITFPEKPITYFYPWDCELAINNGEDARYRYCRLVKISKKIFNSESKLVNIQEWFATFILELQESRTDASPNPQVRVVDIVCTG